jgi:hypothetical protein
MAKEKKSFFERLTGAKSVEGGDFSGVPVYNETEEGLFFFGHRSLF